MRYQILIVFLFLGFALMGQNEQEINIPLNLDGKKGKIHVNIKKGPITVKGTDRKNVMVRYKSLEDSEVKVSKEKNGLKKISGGTPSLNIMEQNGEVRIESETWQKGFNMYIEVPNNFNVDVDSYMEGKVLVENVNGEVSIENYVGDIEATGINGSVNANTYSGSLIINFNQISGDVPTAFHTFNGHIDITLPSNAKINTKVKADNGDIYTGFDIEFTTSKPKVEKQNNGDWNRTLIDGWLEGKINGGGQEMKIKTFNGDIFIRKKE